MINTIKELVKKHSRRNRYTKFTWLEMSGEDLDKLNNAITELEKQNAELVKFNNEQAYLMSAMTEFYEDDEGKSLQAHNLEQQAKGVINITNKAMVKIIIPNMSQTKTEYFKAGIRALAYGIDSEAKALKDGEL